MSLARDAGYTVVEQQIAREMLYIADEIFFTGTAAEITPIRSVDRIVVGAGKRGPITERLQKEFFAMIHGDVEDRYGWLTPLPVEAAVRRRAPCYPFSFQYVRARRSCPGERAAVWRRAADGFLSPANRRTLAPTEEK